MKNRSTTMTKKKKAPEQLLPMATLPDNPAAIATRAEAVVAAAELQQHRSRATAVADPRAVPCRPPICPSSVTCSSPARKFSYRSPRSPSPKRARASPRTSPSPAASWSSCPPSRTSASAAKSPPTKSANASSASSCTSAARPLADSSFAPLPKALRKKISAPISASS